MGFRKYAKKAIKTTFDPFDVTGIGSSHRPFDASVSNKFAKEWNELTGKTNRERQEKHQDYLYSLQELEHQRQDTAWTRQVEDMKSAGLNPILAAGGAGAPTGSIDHGSAPQQSSSNIGKAAEKAMLGMQLSQGAAGISKTFADIALGKSQANLFKAQAEQIHQDIDMHMPETDHQPGGIKWQQLSSNIKDTEARTSFTRLATAEKKLFYDFAKETYDKHGYLPTTEVSHFAASVQGAKNWRSMAALTLRQWSQVGRDLINMPARMMGK